MVPYKSSCGKRLIPSLIDQLARDEPDNPWTSIPVSSNPADGFRDISYSILANAVNRAALWIEYRCGRSADFGTLLYIGLNDARYFIFFAAAVKTGYKVRTIHGQLWKEEGTDTRAVRSSSVLRRTVLTAICGF